MSALRNIHTALRPGGLLLDIHPEPKHPCVEARVGAGATLLGHLDLTIRMQAVWQARTAVQHAIDAGLFMREHDTSFFFVYHFDSLATWLEYMANDWASAGVSAELIERARATLLPSGSAVRIRREIHLTRLRKRITTDNP